MAFRGTRLENLLDRPPPKKTPEQLAKIAEAEKKRKAKLAQEAQQLIDSAEAERRRKRS